MAIAHTEANVGAAACTKNDLKRHVAQLIMRVCYLKKQNLLITTGALTFQATHGAIVVCRSVTKVLMMNQLSGIDIARDLHCRFRATLNPDYYDNGAMQHAAATRSSLHVLC